MPIVKVQVPLFSTGPSADCLVYAKGRKGMTEQRVSEHVKEALAGQPKGFFEGTFRGASWEIGRRVDDQNW